MEIRAFAERVLFATTLEEKIRPPPENISDDTPGPARAAPDAPGRPGELGFKPHGRGQAGAFPGLHELESERERGRLLHFFANHELLATELMALVLLRFPDAPAAFRRGVLKTLRDEQEHTRLYLARMKACGIAFGELPVSGYFWRCVSTMENPIDYVAGLSLTFEQANLDFARHFAQGFSTVGDADTAQLLDRIYHDEIAHVAYGLKWFRRWKNPDESDWDAFCRQLKFPLSPQRAKGVALNVAGRRAAGFDADFIAHLDVFAQSKGRTPGVFLFNPFAEAHIAQGRAFTPNQHQNALLADLATLPQFLCRQDDVVLVPRAPDIGFLSDIKQAGFPLPEFVETGDRPGDAIAALARRKLGRLRPWAWSPECIALLSPLFPAVTGGTRPAGDFFNPEIAPLFSKTWSADFLRRFLANRSVEPWLCGGDEVGVAVGSSDEALAVIAAIRARGHHRVVVKEALGLAGANALRLWEPAISEAQRRWMERASDGGGRLVVEPWLERVRDFSVQYEMTVNRLQLVGFTELITDARGQFLANRAGPTNAKRVPAGVAAYLAAPPDVGARVQQLFEDLRVGLERDFRRVKFQGPVGIDAFVFRDATGVGRLKPVVEINPRYTMGRLTLELMKRTTPGAVGEFRIINRAALRREGWTEFSAYARALRERAPVHLEGEPVPRISRGALCLNDPHRAQASLAVFEVVK